MVIISMYQQVKFKMTKHNKTNEEWVGFKVNNLTVIKKIGEKKYKSNKKYEYITDILLVKCSCGREKEYIAKNLIENNPKTCRFCATTKIQDNDLLGTIINNNTVTEIIYDRYKNGRSVKRVLVKCLDCNNTKLIKLDTFLYEKSSCEICFKSKKSKFNTTNINKYYKKLKAGAKQRKIEFLVDKEYLLEILKKQNNKCYYSDEYISLEDGTASVDRTDNSKGYLKNNIRWVHRSINYMKGSFLEKEFIDLCCKICKKRKS